MFVSNIENFQISAEAAGMIKNGVIIKVLTIDCPRNVRSRRIAKTSPTSRELTTEMAVSPTVALIAGNRSPVLNT